MKIDFSAIVMDRDGKPVQEVDPINSVVGEPAKLRPLTLGAICVELCDHILEEDAREPLEVKLRRAEIAENMLKSVKTREPIELLTSDVDMLKARLARRNHNAHITAAIARLLVPAPKDTKKSKAA